MSSYAQQQELPSEDEFLTQEERTQLRRLLSKPEEFPRELGAWIVDYIAVNQESSRPVGSSSVGIPTATVLPFAAATIPTGWLLCNGQAVARTGDFAALFSAIGTTYGAGDGTTTFNVPDMRGRAPWGKGSQGTVDALGENEGAAEGLRTPHHPHTISDPGHAHGVNDPGHAHNIQTRDGAGGPNILIGGNSTLNNYGSDANTTGISIQSGGTGITVGSTGFSVPNSPSYLVLNFIIKT